MDRVGLATKTSFNTTAKFRTINFQRGANGTHTHLVELKPLDSATAPPELLKNHSFAADGTIQSVNDSDSIGGQQKSKNKKDVNNINR